MPLASVIRIGEHISLNDKERTALKVFVIENMAVIWFVDQVRTETYNCKLLCLVIVLCMYTTFELQGVCVVQSHFCARHMSLALAYSSRVSSAW